MTDATPRALGELARLFLKLGITAFGGPAAHIALMRDEVVRRRQWLTEQQFLDLVGATNLIPGPNSTEMAIHIGLARAGWRGLLVAGACFILPATFLVGGIAWAYVRFGTLPATQALLYGIQPVIIAIVVLALFKLLRTAVKSIWLGALGLAGVAAVASGANEILVLASAGLVAALAAKSPRAPELNVAVPPIPLGVVLAAGSGAAAAVVPWKLFLVFLKAGALLFGSGYVLLAFLRADLVQRLGWLTERQLLDAVAVGQVTPGPVFTTATFIGYVLGGAPGAAIATVGIFLPAFVYVAASAPFLARLRRSVWAAAVLDGVNVASMALMLVVSWHLGRAALVDPLTISVALISGALLLWGRINSAWLILAGGILGLVAGT